MAPARVLAGFNRSESPTIVKGGETMTVTTAAASSCWLCGWEISEETVVRTVRDDRRPTCSDCARIRYGPMPQPRRPRPGRDEVARQIIEKINAALPGASPEASSFLEILVRRAPDMSSVIKVANALGLKTSTAQSRFVRAGLPSLKDYLAMLRLLYASWHFSDETATIGLVVYRLDYSSPQSFARHLRSRLGIAPREFRCIGFQVMLDRFVKALIEPYKVQLEQFDPMRQLLRSPYSHVLSQSAVA